MASYSDNYIIRGPEPQYEATEGGLGFEIFHALKRNRGKIAQEIIHTGETDSYDDLLLRCLTTASFLKTKNFTEDDLICMCSKNNVNSIVPFIAAKFVGVHYVSLEPFISEDSLIDIFEYLKPKLLFVTKDIVEKMESILSKVNYKCELVILSDNKKDPVLPNISKIPDAEEFQPIFLKDLKKTAIILLSSGTTGKPKGICCNHYSILPQVFAFKYYLHREGIITFSNFSLKFNDRQETKMFFYSPMYWITGFLFSLSSIFSGGTRVVGADFHPKEAWKAIIKYKPDSVFLPPGQAHDLCQHAFSEEPNGQLKVFVVGGGAVTKQHMINLGKCFPRTKIVQLYGQTEHSGALTSFNYDDPHEYQLQQSHLNSCGKLFPGSQIRIVDINTKKLCGVNENGELRVKNKFLMNGYYKMDSSSEFDSEGWFRSGDLAYYDENGCIYILDRLKDILRYSIYDIRPIVIEEIMAQHPGVADCIIIGIPHPSDDQHAMGLVVLKKEFRAKITEDEIVSYVNGRVPSDSYKIRAGVKFVDEILKTFNGKPKKLEMKKLIMEGKI